MTARPIIADADVGIPDLIKRLTTDSKRLVTDEGRDADRSQSTPGAARQKEFGELTPGGIAAAYDDGFECQARQKEPLEAR